MQINNRINEVLAVLKLNKNEFARLIKISPALISKITLKPVNFGVDVIQKMLLHGNVNPVWLLTGTGEMFTSSAALTPAPRPSGAVQSHNSPADAMPELSHYDAVRLENLILLGELVSKANASLATGLNLTAGQLQAIAGYMLAKARASKVKASITMEIGTLITPLTLTSNIRSHEQSQH